MDKKGVKFMLSNVIEHKNRKNELLINWINKNNFKVIEYNGKARKNRNEIIVVNYEVIKWLKLNFQRIIEG